MWETLRKEEVLQKLKTDKRGGLAKQEVENRQKEYGKNKLKEKPKETIFVRFVKQFNDFMIIILIIASIISAGVSYMQGENDYIDSIHYFKLAKSFPDCKLGTSVIFFFDSFFMEDVFFNPY